MSIKHHLARMLPMSWQRQRIIAREKRELAGISNVAVRASNLQEMGNVDLVAILNAAKLRSDWEEVKKQTDEFSVPDGTGGVNPGDRRAIHYLMRSIKPTTVLEFGTHIGASTIQIAQALSRNQIDNHERVQLTSVDILDVNNTMSKPWLKYGTTKSPQEMISELGHGEFVNFVTDTSFNFMTQCQMKFDFIFLDGDHAARTVYQEIPLALELLKDSGWILMHDYFPDSKPLWSNGYLIPGPYLATERLRNEGAKIQVLPLGELPWPTKLGSNVSSLALLLKS